MKKRNEKTSFPFFLGIALILAAAVLILDGIGVNLGVGISPWRVIVGVLIIGWIVRIFMRHKPFEVFLPLAILFFVFEAPIAHAVGKEDLISGWVLLLAAILLTVGCKILFARNGSSEKDGGSGGKIGDSSHYLDAASLNDGTADIRDNLGKVQAYISDPAAYTGGGVITIADNLGSVTLHLPRDWAVVTQTRDNLGKIRIPPQETVGDKSVTLVISDNLGLVSVVYD